MTIEELITSRSFDRSIIFGYYGGGNYGDELLLTILINILLNNKNTDIEYAYMNRETHSLLNHTYNATPRFGFYEILKSIFKSKNIIVGGGGHWGLDANKTVFIMSLMLLVMRTVFRKNIYLIGVGYYGSTDKIGHFSARMASIAANEILARDKESYAHFRKLSSHTHLDKDIAFSLDIDGLKSRSKIDDEVDLQSGDKNIFVTLRNFRGSRGKVYESIITELVTLHSDVRFIFLLLEPAHANEQGKDFIEKLKVSNSNVTSYYFHDNPLEIASFFKAHKNSARLIAPQYHAQLTAHLVGMDFLPMSYDNKVSQLLKMFGKTPIPIESVDKVTITRFIEAATS
ncbi:polysaccharide pyruvyl transferase family protein [Candidatus Saccharibacteria bacterium]|nr:polysaccharide pyruvyl transferase family protein [Candidatus Saccharibacteria bacterium]